MPKSTLRYWEKEFAGLIDPERTAGGQRRYTTKDVAVFETIRERKEQGYTLGQIKSQFHNASNAEKGLDSNVIDKLTSSIVEAVRKEISQLLKLEN